MYRNNFIIIFLIVVLQVTFAQNISIQITGTSASKAFLYELSGENAALKDSVLSGTPGAFSFSLSETKYHQGFYRFVFEQNKRIEFLNDGKDVSIKTHSLNIQDSTEVLSSASNLAYYSFIKLNRQYKTKSELLQVILTRFPKDDDFFESTRERLSRLQKEYTGFITSVPEKYPNSFISRYILSAQLPVLAIGTPPDKQLEFLKTHALDNVNFNASELVYSDVFVNKSIEYFTYYRNPQLPKELLEKEFMIAVDTLFNKARVNQIVYQHIADYMINGFKKFGFDKIIDYILENYVIKDDLCLDGKTEGMIKKRIDQSRLLKLGAFAPNLVIPDSAGNTYDLSGEKSAKVLLVFYASWCPHCKEMLPKINDYLIQHKDKTLKVVAISLDTKKADWITFIINNPSNFINLCDLNGWDSKIATDYFLYATPTMFLLDANKKIIGKPTTFEELQALIKF